MLHARNVRSWRSCVCAGVGALSMVGGAMAIPPPGTSAGSSSRRPMLDTEAEPVDGELRVRLPPEGGVAFSSVGGDDCHTAPVTAVIAGPPGVPNVVTINGNSSAATLGPCDTGGFVVWWEAFSIDKCANVIVDFCGTVPRITPMFATVAADCPAGGVSCPTTFLSNDGFSRALCPGEVSPGNGTIFFDALPAGTYYYPIIANGTNPPGPYVMHVSAEECVGACLGCQGGCCNTAAETCADGQFQEDCSGVDEKWFARSDCCAVECRADGGPTYDALDVELLGHVPLSNFPPLGQEGNDVWGFQTALGRKYALLGLKLGTGVVEITDPRNPVVIAQVTDDNSIWSDMKYYRGYAYNVNETGNGVQVIDLTQVDSGVVTLLGSAPGGMQTAHNVALDPVNGFLYPCGTDIAPGFVVFDLADPANPVPVGVYTDVYVHDLYIHSYENCPLPARAGQHCELAYCFAGTADFRIVDVTDKSAITTVSTLAYPTLEYCHQGWISSDGKYIFSNDELDENNGAVGQTRTYVIDIQNVLAPTLAATYDHPGCWIDHNLMTRGGRVYHAHYAAGLRVLDVANPLAPNEIAHFDTHPEDNVQDYVGAWGVYAGFPRVVLISDIERGLFTLCDDPDRSVPSFTVDQHPGYVGTPMAFDATSSTTCDAARTIVGYDWDFDYDGDTFSADDGGSTVNHAYDASGSYTAALRVTDDLGAQEIITLDITVGEPIPAASAWGLVVLGLTIVTAGVMLAGRRRQSCRI